MATIGRHNIALMNSTTTGTGTLTLTTAVSGFLTFALAGVTNSERVTYTIRDRTNTEVGIGTYTSSGTTLSRDTVLSSTNGGSKISCSGTQTVAITIAAEDITPFAYYFQGGATDSISNGGASNLSIDTETEDQAGIATLASNEVTLTYRGFYYCTLSVYFNSATAFNGKVTLSYSNWLAVKGYTTAMNILEDQLYISGIVEASADTFNLLGPVAMANNVGSTISAYVWELSFIKIGNL